MRTQELATLLEFLNVPLASGSAILDRFADLPGAVRRGQGPNQFVYREGARENKVVLVAHADTWWDESDYHDETIRPEVVVENGVIWNKLGGLGADDRAGCAMIWLLRELGHSILITNGEEAGRLGSTWLMNENPDIADDLNQNHQFMMQFDRRRGRDFKCYSVGTDSFRAFLAAKTGYTEPDRNSFTDIVTLCRDICGVNLSMGYYDEHSESESLVVSEWENTLAICRTLLAEETLPRFSRQSQC